MLAQQTQGSQQARQPLQDQACKIKNVIMMNSANVQQLMHLHTPAASSQQMVAGCVALVENPRDPMRGFSYWGYFYFYFTNPSPFNAERTVMPG